MNIKSLGYKTDFFFNQFDGSVNDRGDYIVVKYNSNPNYFWGNLLMYKRPPRIGDLQVWKKTFKNELKDPKIYHMTFAWDSPTGEIGEVEEFIKDGFELDTAVVLTARETIKPKKYDNAIKIKIIDLNKDLEKVIKVQVDSSDEKHLSKKSWEGFFRLQMSQYQRMIKENLGYWFGAYVENELAGTLGIFTDGSIGRFQLVNTAPKFQRRGVCSTLVYESSQYAYYKMNMDTLVMVADENYHAAKVYESVGFKPTQKQAGLCWWDKSRTQ